MENVYKFSCNLVSLFVSHSLSLFFLSLFSLLVSLLAIVVTL